MPRDDFAFLAAGRFIRFSDVSCFAVLRTCNSQYVPLLLVLLLDRTDLLLPDILALAIYECSLTFAEEVEYFWGAPRTGAAVVYYLNKYIFMFMYIAGVVGLALPAVSSLLLQRPMSWTLTRGNPNPRCAKGSRIGFVISLLPYPVSAAFSAMRMFALTGKSWALTMAVLVLSMVPVPINLIVYHFGIDAANIPLVGCIPIDRTPISLGKQATLADVLLRDGTMYFLGLLVLNALMLIFTLENVDIMYGMNSSDVVVFTQSMSAILLHRFLLNLQSANCRTLAVSSEGSEEDQGVTYASMEFGGAEVSRGSTLALEELHGSGKVP
ncbi:hypothetical protein GSI_07538 [Ganoderma sinense ZZ0214-1]|uniref:DUF6533 domain-containing protein n=1 Tax=Ganoderma sinense ZZ0214-1 TaxID=1077348 RepID=A0A2G8S9B6_9APHY|nr:hypothetical protein GSI_07538 [Ganoderma sinense ZZ0214-1]